MKNRSEDIREELLKLALQLDRRLQSAGDDPENAGQADVEPGLLSEEEIAEWQQARQALEFFDQVRSDIERDTDDQIVDTKPNAACAEYGVDPTELLPESGQSLGRFEIIRQLGQGGFAKVFLARDPDLGRQVALKVPRPRVLSSPEAQLRFEREARSAAILSHPAIVPVYESGSVGPISYIASGYCPGISLAAWLNQRDRPISFATSAGIVAGLADAIQHAHQRGVVHRDLKPANILIVDGDEPIDSRVRVVDFGLAKQIQSEDSFQTVAGELIGTPAYMSPEQATGSGQVSESTDVFSLGVILYELLTDSLPFSGDSHLATLRAIENDTPVAPRKRNASVSRDLEAICLHCLEKDPSQRYASAHLLANDLNAWREGHAISARHPTTWEQLIRWTKRRPALTAALVFAFLCLSVGLTLTTWKWRESRFHLSQANQQKERAEKNSGLAQKTIRDMVGIASEELSNVPQLTELNFRLAEMAVEVQEEILQDRPTDPDVIYETAFAHSHLGMQNYRARRFRKALASMNRALELLEQTAQPNGHFSELHGPLYATILLDRARTRANQATLHDALLLIDQIQQGLKNNRFAHSDNSFHIYSAETSALENHVRRILGQHEDAIRAAKQGLIDAGLVVGETENVLLLQGKLWTGLAKLYQVTGDVEQREEAVVEARAMMLELKSLAPDEITYQDDFEDANFAYAEFLRETGNPSDAIAILDETIASYRRQLKDFPFRKNNISRQLQAEISRAECLLALQQIESARINLVNIAQSELIRSSNGVTPRDVERFAWAVLSVLDRLPADAQPECVELLRAATVRVKRFAVHRKRADYAELTVYCHYRLGLLHKANNNLQAAAAQLRAAVNEHRKHSVRFDTFDAGVTTEAIYRDYCLVRCQMDEFPSVDSLMNQFVQLDSSSAALLSAARIYARCSELLANSNAEDAKIAANNAMDYLRRAIQADPDLDRSSLSNEPDLSVLRGREDFQLLLDPAKDQLH